MANKKTQKKRAKKELLRNATKSWKHQKSNKSEYQNGNGGRKTSEASSSNSNE